MVPAVRVVVRAFVLRGPLMGLGRDAHGEWSEVWRNRAEGDLPGRHSRLGAEPSRLLTGRGAANRPAARPANLDPDGMDSSHIDIQFVDYR